MHTYDFYFTKSVISLLLQSEITKEKINELLGGQGAVSALEK